VPSIILVLIIVPSYILLYSLDFVTSPYLTIKVIGKQWFWEYQISDFFILGKKQSFCFSQYMGRFSNSPNSSAFLKGTYRLLFSTVYLPLPLKLHIRFLVSSSDVLHSFSVPSLGLKIDACPGRLNQVGSFINRKGIFYGQCSEICGVGHAFMPIVIVCLEEFCDYIWYLESSFGLLGKFKSIFWVITGLYFFKLN